MAAMFCSMAALEWSMAAMALPVVDVSAFVGTRGDAIDDDARAACREVRAEESGARRAKAWARRSTTCWPGTSASEQRADGIGRTG